MPYKINPFTGEFDRVGGILVESLPTNFLAGSVIFSDGFTFAEDPTNFSYNDATNTLSIANLLVTGNSQLGNTIEPSRASACWSCRARSTGS